MAGRGRTSTRRVKNRADFRGVRYPVSGAEALKADAMNKGSRRRKSTGRERIRKAAGAEQEIEAGYAGAAGTGRKSGASPASEQTSRAVRRNRRRAASLNLVFVLFFSVVTLLTVGMCIYYLRIKNDITSQTKQNETLASELATLRSENDALLENVNNSIDWDYVRDTAVLKLGMSYATEDQIVWYNNSSDSSEVRQYRDVPS
jgi:cell division protein FtsB